MNLDMNASTKIGDWAKEFIIDIEENSEVERNFECCIYRVPKKIQKINEEAYTPQLVSIGPLHHGKEELVDMEKQKRRYVKSFLQRITIDRRKEICFFIENKEQNIRNCYAEVSKLENLEFRKMILYDAIFIIELFIRNSCLDRSDLLLRIPAVNYTIYSDLELLENQLPHFVLREIYNLAFDTSDTPTFVELSLFFFGRYNVLKMLPFQEEVKHFTDGRRSSLVQGYPRSMASNGWIKNLPCAVKLYESGVKFKCIKGECNLLDIKFEKRKHRIPCFKVHELQIPTLEIYNSTECLFRNIIALEQCHYPNETLFCNYIDLLDRLIDTEKDVDLLVGEGIIYNHLGDNASVANMFNKLNQHVHLSESPYYSICEELKQHCSNPWSKKRATLRRVYFSNLWRGTATVAAILLLLLTVIQTICSILQLKLPY